MTLVKSSDIELYISYDGSFEGFLTVIFECYARKVTPAAIDPASRMQPGLFATTLSVERDHKKAMRVWKALALKLHGRDNDLVFASFLSGEPQIEMKLYNFIRRIIGSSQNVRTDFGDADILHLRKTARRVMREALRLPQFVRFTLTGDGLYFAPVEPACDVLPLVTEHFKNRFADQHWLIYDIKRDYGFFFDQKSVHEVVIAEKNFSMTDGTVNQSVNEGEEPYGALWKGYFDSINIPERKNLRLQRRHMPQRYWKFLPEKRNPGL